MIDAIVTKKMIKLILNPYLLSNLHERILLLLIFAMITAFGVGLYYALIVSPIDYQQGEMVRIMYIHVPSAWMALGVYTFIAICSFINLVWKIRMCYLLALSAALPGTIFAFIALVTGSLWGKPMWGVWWVWDARLTSMLILFLFYLSYIIVTGSGDDIFRAEKPASVIAVLGFIDVPIVKFSVNIWYSLHQPASVMRFAKPAIHYSMMIPLLIMFLAFVMYFILVMLLRIKTTLNNIKNSKSKKYKVT